MSVLGDLRAVSGDAVTRLAVRFSDLPRPVLAAIGAGDFLAEQIQEVRGALVDEPTSGARSGGVGSSGPGAGPGGPGAGDPDPWATGDPRPGPGPGPAEQDPFERAVRIAADLAAQIPDRVGRLTEILPERVADLGALAGQLSPDALRDTVEAYGHLAGTVYSALAVRGRRSWSRARAGGGPGSVVEGTTP